MQIVGRSNVVLMMLVTQKMRKERKKSQKKWKRKETSSDIISISTAEVLFPLHFIQLDVFFCNAS